MMAHAVHGNFLGDPCGVSGLVENELNAVLAQMPSGNLSWEEPVLRLCDFPVLTQHGEQLVGKHDVAVLATLALFDA